MRNSRLRDCNNNKTQQQTPQVRVAASTRKMPRTQSVPKLRASSLKSASTANRPLKLAPIGADFKGQLTIGPSTEKMTLISYVKKKTALKPSVAISTDFTQSRKHLQNGLNPGNWSLYIGVS